MTSVALVDDHPLVASGVQATVESTPGFTFLGSAGTVDELLHRFPRPEIVLLDLHLADGSSPVANVERIRSVGAKALVLTSGENPYLLRAVTTAPIHGLVRKSAPVGTLAGALTRVAADELELSADLASAMDTRSLMTSAGLSRQEQRVLELFAQGVKAQAVASELRIALGTVDDYVRRIRAKYERVGRPAYTKVDLYVRAVEDGILPPPHA